MTMSMMGNLAAIHYWAGAFIIGATCGTPEPGQAVVCGAGIFAGGALFSGGMTLDYGAYVVAKTEVVPGIKTAITCKE